MKNVIIYHDKCSDGFTASWAAYRAHKNGLLPGDIEYHPASYSGNMKSIPPDVRGKNVFICDFSYKRDVLLELRRIANNLTVLDHHKSAQDDLQGLDFCIFDMHRSGATLTWDYFFNKNQPGPRPWLVEYIEDRDLWTWKLPNAKEILTALECYPRTFEVWDSLIDDESARDRLYSEGVAMLKFQNSHIELLLRSAYRKNFLGYDVPIINTNIFVSEIGNLLSRDEPFSVVWSHTENKKIRVSLRATSEIDVSKVAEQLGGGGHPKAAGILLSLDELGRLIDATVRAA